MYVYSNMPPNCISQWDDKASKGHVNAHLSFVPGITQPLLSGRVKQDNPP